MIGHILESLKRPPGQEHYRWITEIPNEGLISFRSVFNQNELLAASPRAIADILVEHYNDWKKPSTVTEVLQLLVGERGLILAEGDLHKRLRKLWSPPFSLSQVRLYYPMMLNKALELVRLVSLQHSDLHSDDGYQVVEVGDWVERATTDIIGAVCLGREINALHNCDDELMDDYRTLVQPNLEKQVWFAANMILRRTVVRCLPWKMSHSMETASNTLQRICYEHVKQKRDSVTEDDDQLDMVSNLIRSDKSNIKIVSEQLLTFLSAG